MNGGECGWYGWVEGARGVNKCIALSGNLDSHVDQDTELWKMSIGRT